MAAPTVQHVPIGTIKPNPSNPRTIRDERFHKLVQSIKDFPQMLELRPIVTDADRVVLGGNMRLKACKAAGLKTVPVVVADHLTESQRREFIVKDNVGFGDWDWDTLANEWGDEPLADWGLEVPPIEVEAEGGHTNPDEVPDAPAEQVIKPGDLIALGHHRLLCGDSTQLSVWERLMNGTLGHMAFTSPPYNANNAATGGYKGLEDSRRKQMYVHDRDAMTHDDYRHFLTTVLFNLSQMLDEQAVVGWNVAYNAHSRRTYGEIIFSTDNPLPVQESIVWDKTMGMNVAGTHIYSRSSEFVYLLSRTDKYRSNQDGGVYWNTWRITTKDGDNMQNGHGASFPVALPIKAIEQHTSVGHIVLDPFLGSGTTLIAAEQTKRVCYGTELEPRYCDIIVKRWQDFTGQTATYADTGQPVALTQQVTNR